MKKMMRKFIAVLLAVVMFLPIVGLTSNKSQASVNYNRTAAINYAATHWNDGVGQCAQFVSACLTAGGLSVSQNVCLNLWNTLKKYGTPYKLTATSSGNGNIKLSANAGKVEAGDPLFYVCDTCGGVNSNSAFPHVVICGGTNSSGFLTAYGHNAAWNNKLVWTQFSSGAHAGHSTNIYSIHIDDTAAYTLAYNANGGIGAPSSQTGATSYTISSSVPARFGYSFKGWTVGSNGYTIYWPGSSISISSNTTMYAAWETYILSDTGGNGDSLSHGISFPGQEQYYKFVPSATGYYIFDTGYTDESLDTVGYLYDSSGNQLKYNDDGNVNKYGSRSNDFRIIYYVYANTTYYLKVSDYGNNSTGVYTVYAYPDSEIYYDANGGSGAPSTQTGDNEYIIPSTTPARSGYVFLGWSTNRNATSASYHPGDYIEPADRITTLYAVWKSNPTYTLTYNANGGLGAPSSQSGETSYTISSIKPTRSGYTFLGWSTSSSATYATYVGGNTITLSSNTTLYAVWQKNAVTTYTLTYNANGGSGAPSSQSGETSYTILSIKPTRSGYTFLGWSTSSSATYATYVGGNTITLSSNTTLYAVWQKNAVTTYTLTYNANGGSGAPSSQSGKTSYTISSIKPTRSGYTLLGWSESSSATSASYVAGDTINISANTILYAVWQKNVVVEETPAIKIRNNPGSRAINHGEILHVVAETQNMPEGAKISWRISNDSTGVNGYIDETDNTSCYIQAAGSGSCTVYALVVDAEGNPILDKDGNEIYDSQKITVNSGLWQRIISFFKNLFGMNRVIVQAFKSIL